MQIRACNRRAVKRELSLPLGVSLMHRYEILSMAAAVYAGFHLRSSNSKAIDRFCVTFLILSDQLIRGKSSLPLSTWRIVRFMSDEKAARLFLPLIRLPPSKSASVWARACSRAA